MDVFKMSVICNIQALENIIASKKIGYNIHT